MGKQPLRVLTLTESREWDDTIRSFNLYDTYYMSGYTKSFHVHGDGEPLLFYYNDGIIKGINVSMKRSITEDPLFKGAFDNESYFDLATPYGYGGWIIENTAQEISGGLEALFQNYESWCSRNNIVSEFVRFHPVIENHNLVKGYYDVINLGRVVAMDLTSPDTIWENISSKNRNVIRKAIKNDVKIYNGRFPNIYKTFREIYNSTMDIDGAEEYYYFENPFYESICEELPENAQVFWAEKDGAIIAASIMLECNGYMNYHLSGSLREYRHFAATNLLLYKAALWGSAHGLKTLHLGGGIGSDEDSLFKFKKSFYKGEPKQFHIGCKIFNPTVYHELTMRRAGSIKNENFFPLYRG